MATGSHLSMVIPTRNRHLRLFKTLESLAHQESRPEEVIIVVAEDHEGKSDFLSRTFKAKFQMFSVIYALKAGAASQRNEGVRQTNGSFVGFCDDDIDFEDKCIARLRAFLQERSEFSGVGAVITNQAPRHLGRLTKFVLRGMDENRRKGLAFDGRVIGPGINTYPIYDPVGPPFRETEWLSSTAAIYRREVLPEPVFDSIFQGYSFCEDLALSCRVAKVGRLAVLRDARVFHDSQPGDHKANERGLGHMEIINRFYVATVVLGRKPIRTWQQLLWWTGFCFLANLRRNSPVGALKKAVGAVSALLTIVASRINPFGQRSGNSIA